MDENHPCVQIARKEVLCILFPELQLTCLKLGRCRVEEEEFLCCPSMFGKILLKEPDVW